MIKGVFQYNSYPYMRIGQILDSFMHDSLFQKIYWNLVSGRGNFTFFNAHNTR